MKYYSTNHTSPESGLDNAVVRGLAPDRGLYMPERIERLPDGFIQSLPVLTLRETAFEVASALFGEDIPEKDLHRIVNETLNFDIPLVEIKPGRYALELFHGPTLAFKDVGARFMARLLGHFNKGEDVHVLVATSGDTGSAVANGFLNVPGVKVHVLYPSGKVSSIQEAQFTTLGANITALEIDGTFDDCQNLVKQAFMDQELTSALKLTSANSINVARFLPQMFYYFYAWGQLAAKGADASEAIFAVPSGNFGNLCAGLIAKRMGLPIKGFIAANNANDVVYEYLTTGKYTPRKSVSTIANAMDVGDPSNFARILELYGNDHGRITADITGCTYTDAEIEETMKSVYDATGYILDPHGAVAMRALEELTDPSTPGVLLETAHPAKFKETVDRVLGADLKIPDRLGKFMEGKKETVAMKADFDQLKNYLLSQR